MDNRLDQTLHLDVYLVVVDFEDCGLWQMFAYL
jgi:hypothetical protein